MPFSYIICVYSSVGEPHSSWHDHGPVGSDGDTAPGPGQSGGSSASGLNHGDGGWGSGQVQHVGDITARNLHRRLPRFEPGIGVWTADDVDVGDSDTCDTVGESDCSA